jgi:hypothetical protein
MMAAATQLADLLAEENAALAALDLPRVAAMLPDKQRATAELDAAQADSAAHAGDPATRLLAQRLLILAEQNRALLERAITVQGRVIAVIARAIPRAVTTPRYGLNGSLAHAGRPTAFAFSARA